MKKVEDNPQENDRFTPEQLKLPPPMFLPGSGEMAFDDLLKDKNELREFKAFLEGMDEKGISIGWRSEYYLLKK